MNRKRMRSPSLVSAVEGCRKVRNGRNGVLCVALMTAAALLIATTAVVVVVEAGVKVAPRNCGGAVRHVRVSVGGGGGGPTTPSSSSTSMIVSFASIPSRYAPPPVGGVLVGTSPSKLDRLFLQGSEEDSVTSYNLTSPNRGNYDDGNTYYSPYYHHVTATGLEPSTTYFYKPIVHANVREFQRYVDVDSGDNNNNDAAAETAANLRTKKTKEESLQVLKDIREDEEDERDPGRRRAAATQRQQQQQQRQPHGVDKDTDELVQEQEVVDPSDYNHRFLVNWPPYDGSEKDCPSPDKVRSFRTVPAEGDPDQKLTLAVMGDIGQFPHSEETLSRMLRESSATQHSKYDALILAGDVAYTQYDHRRWDTCTCRLA